MIFANRTILLASALFGFFLGRAILAKGPAAIILCGGAVFFWALATNRWRDTLRLLHPVGIVVFCLTALPWYVLCALRNPDFLRVFIVEHNFKRFLTPEFQHIQPFWFYAEIILLAFLPWTAALIWALIVGLRRLRQTETERICLLSVVLGGILRGIFYDFPIQVAWLYSARRTGDRTPSRSLGHISGVDQTSVLRTRLARRGRAIRRLGDEGDRRAIV